jgi:hypothetical protein
VGGGGGSITKKVHQGEIHDSVTCVSAESPPVQVNSSSWQDVSNTLCWTTIERLDHNARVPGQHAMII